MNSERFRRLVPQTEIYKIKKAVCEYKFRVIFFVLCHTINIGVKKPHNIKLRRIKIMLYVYHQVYRPSLSLDGTTVTLVHFGEYRYLSEAYSALTRFIEDNFLVAKDTISVDYVKNERDTHDCDSYVTVLSAKVRRKEGRFFFDGERAYA